MGPGLVIIGAVTALSAPTPVTAHQARQALLNGAWVEERAAIACEAVGNAQLCQASDSTAFADAVFGPSRIVGTTTFNVSRHGHNYRVRVVVPDHFDIFAGQ